jgi:hypothetical protein
MIGGGNVASGELMYFAANKTSIKRIANARNVEFRINNYSELVPAESRDLFNQVASARD